jgi:hypothetical protein
VHRLLQVGGGGAGEALALIGHSSATLIAQLGNGEAVEGVPLAEQAAVCAHAAVESQRNCCWQPHTVA